jgi:hypothetical protein
MFGGAVALGTYAGPVIGQKLQIQLVPKPTKPTFESVMEALSSKVDVESQLTVEINGSVSLKAKGGLKYLFFNIGAETANTNTMKVTLSTTLQPKIQKTT